MAQGTALATIDRPRDGLGASDAAAILGVSRWRTALDVFNDKTGIATDDPKQEHQEWGLLLEPALAGRYSQVAGRRLRRVGTLRSKVHPLLYAHPDRLVVGEPGLVEIKVSSRSWQGEIPIYYKTQAIQQLIVSDREWVDFAVLERGQRFAVPIPRYERDRAIEPDFIAELEEWWERHIVAGVPPDMDGSDGGRRYLMATHPSGEGEIVATTAMLKTIDAYKIATYNRKQVEQEEERLKQEVMKLIGDGTSLVGPFGRINWTRYTMTRTSWQAVAAAYRQMLLTPESGAIIPRTEEALDTIVSLHTGTIPATRLTPTWKQEESDD